MKFTNNDLEKIKTVLNLSEKEFIGLIENNDIIKIANDYESAYKDLSILKMIMTERIYRMKNF